jgi:hypothetical protein
MSRNGVGYDAAQPAVIAEMPFHSGRFYGLIVGANKRRGACFFDSQRLVVRDAYRCQVRSYDDPKASSVPSMLPA